MKKNYYVTIFVSGPERQIQQFDWFLSGPERQIQQFNWFLSGLELAVLCNFRNKTKIYHLWNKMANNFRTTLW